MRAFFVRDADDGKGQAVIANNAKEAKTILWNKGLINTDYIYLSVWWIKNANVNGLNKGLVLDDKDALIRKIYSMFLGSCDICGKAEVYLHELNGKAVCVLCYDKEAEA